MGAETIILDLIARRFGRRGVCWERRVVVEEIFFEFGGFGIGIL